MKTIKLFILSTILLLSIFSANCQSEGHKNYIVLLDLSDRLLSPHQKDYDIKVINTVFKKFEESVQSKLFLTSEDSFSIRIVPQNSSPVDAYEYGNLLSIDLENTPPQERVSKFRKFKESFFSNISKLYDRAKFSENSSDYKGVDLWQYFNQSIEYDLIASKQNILLILSDGYFDFENYPQGFKNKNRFTSTSFIGNLRTKEWKQIDLKNNYGLIPVNSISSFNVKIIIAGVRPKSYIGFLDENRILKYYWKKWFDEMNINEHYQISYANSPSVYNLIKNTL